MNRMVTVEIIVQEVLRCVLLSPIHKRTDIKILNQGICCTSSNLTIVNVSKLALNFRLVY